jgi:hypothetical protein
MDFLIIFFVLVPKNTGATTKTTTRKSIPSSTKTQPKPWPMVSTPPPSAHFQLFGGKKKVSPLQTQHHNLSNNYIKMEHRNDGNFLITQQISSALRAKNRSGPRNTLTKWCSILARFSLGCLTVLSLFWTTLLST